MKKKHEKKIKKSQKTKMIIVKTVYRMYMCLMYNAWRFTLYELGFLSLIQGRLLQWHDH